MTTAYRVQVIHVGGDPRVEQLSAALQREIAQVGLHQSVDISVASAPLPDAPTVAVFFGGKDAAVEPGCIAAAEAAVADVVTTLPVVDDLVGFADLVPEALTPINGMQWGDDAQTIRIARRVLEELGIEERQRKVFISHKREDGLWAAEQLFDALGHHGFRPFVDRFNIPAGEDIQARIADELEDYAFLLLLETPRAHESDWVFDEVDYALAHGMGMHIVRWPRDFDSVPATNGLDRQVLQSADLETAGGSSALKPDTISRVLEEVEAAHARSMVRRRRNLLRNVEDAAEAAGHRATPLGGWRLAVDHPAGRDVVQVAGRLPMVQDLHALDGTRDAVVGERGVLVHAARILRPERRTLLEWAVGARPLDLVPENGIAGYW